MERVIDYSFLSDTTQFLFRGGRGVRQRRLTGIDDRIVLDGKETDDRRDRCPLPARLWATVSNDTTSAKPPGFGWSSAVLTDLPGAAFRVLAPSSQQRHQRCSGNITFNVAVVDRSQKAYLLAGGTKWVPAVTSPGRRRARLEGQVHSSSKEVPLCELD
jgi:hypothetical protein